MKNNREIKFRAFIRGEMVELPFAALQYFDFEGSYALSFVVDAYDGFWAHEQYDKATKEYCKNAPIMQYIGIKDKNQKEIYEGDIVNGGMYNGSYKLGIIVFNNGKFYAEPIGKFSEGISEEWNWFEVVGNIYENPELL